MISMTPPAAEMQMGPQPGLLTKPRTSILLRLAWQLFEDSECANLLSTRLALSRRCAFFSASSSRDKAFASSTCSFSHLSQAPSKRSSTSSKKAICCFCAEISLKCCWQKFPATRLRMHRPPDLVVAQQLWLEVSERCAPTQETTGRRFGSWGRPGKKASTSQGFGAGATVCLFSAVHGSQDDLFCAGGASMALVRALRFIFLGIFFCFDLGPCGISWRKPLESMTWRGKMECSV